MTIWSIHLKNRLELLVSHCVFYERYKYAKKNQGLALHILISIMCKRMHPRKLLQWNNLFNGQILNREAL